MTASTLDRLIAADNLLSTWKEFWRHARRQHSSGVDGIKPADFARNLDRNLSRLRADLRAGYRFSPLRGHPVPKKDGKQFRIICIPTVQDRLVQRVLAGHLTEKADRLGIINDVSYGFIPSRDGRKRGVTAARDRAIELRSEHRWAYKSDISAFFDRIPRDHLIDQTIRSLRARSLSLLLLGAVSCEIDERDPAIKRMTKDNKISRGLGVRQGMPLSPLFANVILRNFDKEMMKRGKRLVRYADDFIVFADSETECCEIDSLARRLLAPLGLELPQLGEVESKTKIARPEAEIEFLGLALAPNPQGAYSLLITEKQFEKIRRSLFTLKDVDELIRQEIDITILARQIEAKVGGYLAAYGEAHNIDALRRILVHSRSEILRAIFVKAFGEAKVSSLSHNLRKFFCLVDA